MKKFLTLILVLLIVFSLCSCSTEGKKEDSTIPSQTERIETTGQAQSQDSTTGTEKQDNQTEDNAHTHSYTSVQTPATCQKQGFTTHTCSCGHSYVDAYVNGTHKFENNKCTYCNVADTDGLYTFLKNWVIDNGTLNGDYVYYSKTADNYGGYGDEDFSLYYWADTEKVEFCLHSVLDADYSINFYIYVPSIYSGSYEYITSYYYRDTGASVCESKGVIDAKTFTKKQPLSSKEYFGSTTLQNDFMEMSRQGICDTLDCLKQFLQAEKMGYTLADIGFANWN